MNIALVEDNKEYAKLLLNEIGNRNMNLNVELFENGEQFIESNFCYDLVILDIELPDIDGIMISKTKISSNTKIVFLTSIKDRVFEAFGENVIGYLLKGSRIQKTVDDLVSFVKQLRRIETIEMVTEFGVANIDIMSIIMVTKENRRIYLTTDKMKFQVYRNSLTNIQQNASKHLIYINKSTLINVFRIISFTDNKILLEKGIEDKISRDYLQRFKKEYLERIVL